MKNLRQSMAAILLGLALSAGPVGQAQNESLKLAITNIERAAFWKARGFEFNPHKLSAQEMDMRVQEENPLVYEREVADPLEQPGASTPAQIDPAPTALSLDQLKADAERARSEAGQRALLYGRGLRDLGPVAVKVNLTEASFRKPALWTSEGITGAQIKREVETALASAGIKVVPALGPGTSGLRISASSIDTAHGSYELRVDMRLLDRVVIARSGVTTLAITWKHSLSGYLDDRHDAGDGLLAYVDEPRQLIRRGVNSFVNDWLQANAQGDTPPTGEGGVRDTGHGYLVPEQALLDMAILLSLDRKMMDSVQSRGNEVGVPVGQSILQATLSQYLRTLGIGSDKMKQRHGRLLKPAAGVPFTARFGYVDLPPMSLVDFLQAHAQVLQDPNETTTPTQ